MSSKKTFSLQPHPRALLHAANYFALLLLFFFSGMQTSRAQVTISSFVLGENAWYLNHDPAYFNINAIDWTAMQSSGVKSMRIGGIDYNWNQFTEANLKTIVKTMRQHGIEPLVQVGYIPGTSITTQATSAATLVHDLDNDADPDYHVTYWIIANEPDYNLGLNAASIHNYIVEYSQRMKGQVGGSGDPNIKIIGPELASYYDTYSTYLQLTDQNSSTTNIIPYIDIFSYHIYPFGNEDKVPVTDFSAYEIAANRENVIRYLSGLPSPVLFANGATTNPLRNALAQIRARLNANGGSALGMALTEANICYFNDVDGYNSSYNNDTPNGNGNGANSFIAGQFWAEVIAEAERANIKFVNFWSTKEGQSADNYKTNVGFINSNPSQFGGAGGLKSTYYHCQLMSNFTAGTFYPVTGETSNSDTHVKAYVLVNGSTLKILVLNQEVNTTGNSSSNRSISIKFSNSAPSGSGTYKFHTDVTVPGLSVSELTISNIDNESSWVYEYNTSGTLTHDCYCKRFGSAYSCENPCTPPTASASSNSPVCESATIMLSANTVAGATYSWTGPDGWTSNQQNPQRTGAADYMGGTYTLTITLGCTSAPATTAVSVPQFSTISPSGNVTACGSQLLTGPSNPGGYVYHWEKDGVDVGGNTQTYNALVSGSYQLRITNGTCTDWSAPTNVTINSVPTATASSNSPVCQSATIMLSANGVAGATYSWTGPDAWTSNQQNPQRTGAAVTMAGNYTLTITSGSCTSAPSVTYVDVPNFASIGVGGSTTFCSGQGRSVTLYAATGSGYRWQWMKDGTNLTNDTLNHYVASVAGNYQVRILRPVGCYAWSAPTTVTTNTSLYAAITPAGPTWVCYPATVLLYGNTCNGYTYQWQKRDPVTGQFVIIAGATNVNYTATASGDYQLRTTSGVSNYWSSPVTVTIYQCRESDTTATTMPAETTTAAGMSVFPNPSAGTFTISLAGMDESGKNIRIDVLNTMGQLVSSENFAGVTQPSMETSIDIDKSNADGLYLIRVTIGETVLYDKVMVQH